jgi:hypothetical protein
MLKVVHGCFEHLRSCSILQDKLSDVDDFDNMTKTEKESVCYWLARSMICSIVLLSALWCSG